MSEFLLGFKEDDLRALAKAVQEQLSKDITKNKSDQDIFWENASSDHQAPESYIVKTEAEVPARTATTPGSADVQVQDITGVPDSESLNESTAIVPKTAFNISDTAIAADTYITIQRDKFGRWIFLTPGSGGGATIMFFTITAVDCDVSGVRFLTVAPNYIAPPCITTPGADSYGDFIVYDDALGCILPEYTDAELIGLKGMAAYTSLVDQTYGCDKGWTLMGLCDTGSC
tara:strand:+ start:34237 stop:34926 length:690 start_codon:yes stop_codon:yes gene_type:complete